MKQKTKHYLYIPSICLIALLAGIGYGWNIVQLMGLDGFTGEMVVRILGILIIPLGMLIGWL